VIIDPALHSESAALAAARFIGGKNFQHHLLKPFFFLYFIRTCGVCHREMTGLKGNPVKVRNSTRCCNPAPAARLVERFANNATVPVLGWEGW